MRVNDYKVVSAKSPEELEKLVREAIRDGWRLYEAPFATADHVCQAMVRVF